MDIKVRCRALYCAALLTIFIFSGFGITKVFAKASLDKTSAVLGVGKKTSFSVDGTTKKIKWKSSDKTIAKVTKKGVVKGLAPGEARITATVGKQTLTAKVSVRSFLINDKKTEKVELSGEKNVFLTLLTEDGSIRSKVADPDICTVALGDWLGDDLTVSVIPKQIGSTKVIFSNTMNNETCILKVKVKAVPVIATLDDPVISTGAKYFITPENSMSVSFTLSGDEEDCRLLIYGEDGSLIKTISAGAVAANVPNTVFWDGTDDSLLPYEGGYTYAVKAGSVEAHSDKMFRIMQKSPFRGGDGSAEKPYLFGNTAELALIPRYDDEGVYFKQCSDIDLNGNSEIGELFPTAPGLMGSISGMQTTRRYEITNYMSSKPFIGYVSKTGCVSNITMSEALISGSGSCLVIQNYGTIENCNINATVNITRSNNLRAAVIAESNYGNITSCECSGAIRMTLNSLISLVTVRVGGITAENNGQIFRCESKTEIGVTMSMAASVEEGSYLYVGGITGENPEGSVISDSVHVGKITANTGTAENAPVAYIGGVCGVNNGITSGCRYEVDDESIKESGYGAGISS